jgi:hypothetical protein
MAAGRAHDVAAQKGLPDVADQAREGRASNVLNLQVMVKGEARYFSTLLRIYYEKVPEAVVSCCLSDSWRAAVRWRGEHDVYVISSNY